MFVSSAPRDCRELRAACLESSVPCGAKQGPILAAWVAPQCPARGVLGMLFRSSEHSWKEGGFVIRGSP